MSSQTAAVSTETLEKLHQAVVMESKTGVMIVSAMIDPMATIFVNQAYEKITGYSAAESVGKAPGRLHRDDGDQPGLRELRQALSSGRATSVVLRNYRKDGQLFWNDLSVSPVRDAQGRLTHWLGLVNDVSAQKKAQEEMLDWAFRLEALASLSMDGLATFDGQRRVSYVNRALLDLLGLNQSSVIGLDIGEFDRLFRERSESGKPYPEIYGAELCGANGRNCPESAAEIQLAGPPPRTLLRRVLPGGHDVSCLAYFQDITKARQLEQMKSEFLATAAHELRTPMASILGFAELLQQRQFDEKTLHEVVEIIVRQSRRITDMLNELLDLARIEARRGKDFICHDTDIREVVRAAVAPVQKGARQIVLEGMDVSATVSVDAGKIQQALTNLLNNAAKFSAPDTPISVSIRREDSSWRAGIVVSDRGIGMTEAQLARLGERFYRVDPSGNVPGTGLGISLVKEIINLHGGTFEPACSPGDGCRMTVWLPMAPTNEAQHLT